jgi:UDP:flavonoid glycosyltransferase YjiC (YdhE family)
MPKPVRIAFFVTPHGFGHAARAAALLAALKERLSSIEVELWTTVPRWFFEESLGFPFLYRECSCDVGLVQTSPVEEDLAATVAALERLWTADTRKAHTREVGSELVASGTNLVLCDIAPFGLAAANAAGLPSVLLENFTWDWIYEPLVEREPRFEPWIPFLRDNFALADLHLQLEPVCAPAQGAVAVPPLARALRASRDEVRQRLAVPVGGALVLVSMGGIRHRLENVAPLFDSSFATFVLLGSSDSEETIRNVRLLPHHSPIYHPDLVAAAGVVVGKLGYSTVAEAVAAGTRMLYVPRRAFRESAVLERYVGEWLPAAAISWEELESGAFAARLPGLLAAPSAPHPADGARAAAAQIVERFF